MVTPVLVNVRKVTQALMLLLPEKIAMTIPVAGIQPEAPVAAGLVLPVVVGERSSLEVTHVLEVVTVSKILVGRPPAFQYLER
jgi:hypothetical protein